MTNNKNPVEKRNKEDIKNKILVNISERRDIGKTMVSDKFPITTDSFWFALGSNVIVNPFDFVTVENVNNTKTIGIVKELQTVMIDGLHYHSLFQDHKEDPLFSDAQRSGQMLPAYEITIAKVAIMANTGVKIEETKNRISINMPLRSKKIGTICYSRGDNIFTRDA